MKFKDESIQIAYDSLEQLKESKFSEIKANNNHIEGLQMENEGLEKEIKGIDEALKCLEKDFGGRPTTSNGPPSDAKYSNLSLSEAIIAVLNEHGNHPGLLVPEIIEKLKAGGFKSDAKNLYASAYSVAMSLLSHQKVKESEKLGKRSFVKK